MGLHTGFLGQSGDLEKELPVVSAIEQSLGTGSFALAALALGSRQGRHVLRGRFTLLKGAPRRDRVAAAHGCPLHRERDRGVYRPTPAKTSRRCDRRTGTDPCRRKLGTSHAEEPTHRE